MIIKPRLNRVALTSPQLVIENEGYGIANISQLNRTRAFSEFD
jgi:hypothetical protein